MSLEIPTLQNDIFSIVLFGWKALVKVPNKPREPLKAQRMFVEKSPVPILCITSPLGCGERRALVRSKALSAP